MTIFELLNSLIPSYLYEHQKGTVHRVRIDAQFSMFMNEKLMAETYVVNS